MRPQPMPRRTSLLVMTLSLAPIGCDPGKDLERSSQNPAEMCRLGPAPALSVGGIAPPAHIFGEVPDVARLPDDRIAVVDRQAQSVTIFDNRGHLVQTLGRQGEGPGEFLDPIGLVRMGDSLLVWDWRQSRVTAFDLSSDEATVIRVDEVVNPTHHFGDVPDGFVVGSVLFPDGGTDSGSWTNDLGVIRWDSTQVELDTVVAVRYRESEWVDEATRMAGSRTFSPRGTFAAGNGRIYWAAGDSAVVHFWDHGETGKITWVWPTRLVETGDVDLYRERWLAGVSEGAHEAITNMIAKLPVAESYPVIADLVADVDGGVWVGIYSTPRDSSQTWLRFEDGQQTCRIEFPRSFEPSEGGSDWVLGVHEDELDVQSVQLWLLNAGESSGTPAS